MYTQRPAIEFVAVSDILMTILHTRMLLIRDRALRVFYIYKLDKFAKNAIAGLFVYVCMCVSEGMIFRFHATLIESICSAAGYRKINIFIYEIVTKY